MNKEIRFSKAMLPPLEEYYEQLKDIWKSGWLATFGPKHLEFENRLKEFLENDNVLAFTNGHTALESIIGALQANGEIITTPFTFISTANAIYRNGFMPVFCDIDENMTIDVDMVETLISEKTVAVVATHVLGNPCCIEKLEKIGKEYNIKIIYDGAHVFGVKYKGKFISDYGDATMYSFHASKVFNCAEGGAVVFNDEKLGIEIKKFRYYGMDNYQAVMTGLNGKMHEITAALGICNLRHLSNVIERRKILFERYVNNLKNTVGIYVRKAIDNVEYNYIYFYILVNQDEYGISAENLLCILNNKGIHAKKCFPMLISEMKAYKECRKGNLSKSYFFLENIIILPLFIELLESDIDYICDIINVSGKKERR